MFFGACTRSLCLTMREFANRVQGRARSLFRRVYDEAGAVATEYGLTLLLISLAIIVAATGFGIILAALFDDGTAAFPAGGS
jgi:Flp pilus assembly pilin Flp